MPADEFMLERTLEQMPDAEFEIERVVATEATLVPFVWAMKCDPDRLNRLLDDDPTVENVRLLAEFDEEWLYRMDWVENETLVEYVTNELQAVVQQAFTDDDSWRLTIVFTDREDAAAANAFCRERGIDVRVDRIYEIDKARRAQFDLTESQYEAVKEAFERGYYEIPSRASTEELAAEFGISQQALSERLQRAHGNLVKNVVSIGRDVAEFDG